MRDNGSRGRVCGRSDRGRGQFGSRSTSGWWGEMSLFRVEKTESRRNATMADAPGCGLPYGDQHGGCRSTRKLQAEMFTGDAGRGPGRAARAKPVASWRTFSSSKNCPRLQAPCRRLSIALPLILERDRARVQRAPNHCHESHSSRFVRHQRHRVPVLLCSRHQNRLGEAHNQSDHLRFPATPSAGRPSRCCFRFLLGQRVSSFPRRLA